MKSRNGFVSNSSSQSFVVFGIRLSRDDLAEFGIEVDDAVWNSDEEAEALVYACFQELELHAQGIEYNQRYDRILAGVTFWAENDGQVAQDTVKDAIALAERWANRIGYYKAPVAMYMFSYENR